MIEVQPGVLERQAAWFLETNLKANPFSSVLQHIGCLRAQLTLAVDIQIFQNAIVSP